MNIQKFLIENLVDTYNSYCECVEGISSLDFDAQFMDDDGNTISDLEFIYENYKKIFITEVFDSLYSTIVDFGNVKEIDLDKVVAFLASKYFIYNYKSAPNVVTYLKISSNQDIVELFKNNCDFGIDMIKAFFYSLIDSKRYDDNRKLIYENNDQERLLQYEKEFELVNITTINSVLRELICNIYNHYINLGYDDIEALSYTWLFFIQGFNHINSKITIIFK